MKQIMINCLICNVDVSINGLHQHLKHHNMTAREYYIKFLKKEHEGVCKEQGCSNPTELYSKGFFSKGYKPRCKKHYKKNEDSRKKFNDSLDKNNTRKNLSLNGKNNCWGLDKWRKTAPKKLIRKLQKENGIKSGNTLRGRTKEKYEYLKRMSENRMGEKNPIHKITKQSNSLRKKRQSRAMKLAIKEGRFTPCITNSWTSKTILVGGIKYRSTWGAVFQLLNKNLEYEIIRLSYKYKNKNHNYIVDFYDRKNKILYEIKPLSQKNNSKNICKFEAANKWCKENGHIFKIISDDYFKKFAKTVKYNLYPDLLVGMKQFLK